VAVTVKVVKDTGGAGLDAMKKRLGSLDRSVLVGVPAGKREPDGTSTALVAAVNEFGSGDGRIPARPFLRPAIRDNLPEFRRLNAGTVSRVARDQMAPVKALDTLGVVASGKVKKKIVDGPFQPNAPSTIKRKKSSRPLIDTGSMRQSITHVLDDGRGGPGVVR
jgi:hypothetical protein